MNKFIFLIFIFFDTTIILSQDFSEKYYKFEGDSIYTSQIELDEITIYKPVKLESDRDLIMYYTLKRKTLKVYPYAKMASERLDKLDHRLTKIKSKRKKKKYTKILERFIKDELTEELKKLTRSEGQILVKLIYRETGVSAFKLIKELRNGFRAFTYNTFANLFDISLKVKYNPELVKEDLFIEDILAKEGY